MPLDKEIKPNNFIKIKFIIHFMWIYILLGQLAFLNVNFYLKRNIVKQFVLSLNFNVLLSLGESLSSIKYKFLFKSCIAIKKISLQLQNQFKIIKAVYNARRKINSTSTISVIVTMMVMMINSLWKCFTQTLTGNLLLESEWQQVSSDLQNSSKYPRRFP